jgi:hypothetical protein
MAFRASITTSGKTFDVLACNYEFDRDVDSKGRPASNVYGGKVTVKIESTADTSLIEQMISQFKPISGSVTFQKGDEDAKMKELKFETGYIIGYKENFDIVGAEPMTITFTISAKSIKIGSADFEQNWPE